MPRLTSSLPKYRRHRATGQAVVVLDGRYHYLGPWGTKASRNEYERLTGEWLANGRRLGRSAGAAPTTVAELILAYWKRCQGHYRKPSGEPTSELALVRMAMKPLKALYGAQPAESFGPLALKAVRQKLVDANISRGVVNSQISRIKRMFRWAVENEMVPSSTYHGLAAVAGLQRGRTDARETAPIQPVSEEAVNATLAHVPPIVADLIRLQRLTGARPEEVCLIRPCDIDRSAAVWSYRPASHKTQHHGHDRVIFIGPLGQALLRPYLLRPEGDYCFAPNESERKRNAQRREERQTPMTPSQSRRRPKRQPKRAAGRHYTTASYRRAIHRACELAFPAPEGATPEELKAWRKAHRWHPNQLRHSAATEIRRKFGLEAAQVTLGHTTANVSQIYAERDFTLAARVMQEVG